MMVLRPAAQTRNRQTRGVDGTPVQAGVAGGAVVPVDGLSVFDLNIPVGQTEAQTPQPVQASVTRKFFIIVSRFSECVP
jgi:hypothetical protein